MWFGEIPLPPESVSKPATEKFQPSVRHKVAGFCFKTLCSSFAQNFDTVPSV